MKNRFLVVLMALACAFGMTGLAACSGGTTASGSAQAESTASDDSASTADTASAEDEAAIKQDAEKTIAALSSKESIEAMLNSTESLASLKDLGIDFADFAEVMSGIIKYEVTDVKVDGETAVATVRVTSPDWNDDVNAKLQQTAAAALEGIDFESMSQEDAIAAYLKAYLDAVKSADFPMASQDVTFDYVKDGDTWKMKNSEAFQEELASVSAPLGSGSSAGA